MKVYIQGKYKQPKYEFWNFLNGINTKYDKIDLSVYPHSLNEEIYDEKTIKSNGILVCDRVNNKIYMITTYKTGEYSDILTTYFKINDDIYNVNVKKISDCIELQLSIFECEYMENLRDHCFFLEELDGKINDNNINNICKIKKYRVIRNGNNNLEFNDKEINVMINNIKLFSPSKLLVKVPVYEFEIMKGIDDDDIHGSIIYDNYDKLIGIVSDYKNGNTYYCIPIYYSKYIIDMINNDVDISRLRSIILETRPAMIVFNDIENHICNYVNNNYNLKYKNIMIPKNSLITDINDSNFNDKGYIYCSKLDYYIPIETYILLYNELDSIEIEYYNKRYMNGKIINVVPIDYKEYLLINVKNNNRCLIIHGMVFIEANEEYLQRMNINIRGYLTNMYERKYDMNNRKIMILVDILYDKISNEIERIYRKNDLPMINIENNSYYIPVLRKYGEIIVRNFDTKLEKSNIIIMSKEMNKQMKINIQ